MKLTQKETTLLKDMMDGEKVCAEKYARYATEANDPQLKNLFSELSAAEQGHYNGLSTLSGGEVPQAAGGGSASMPTFKATYTGESEEKKNDAFLCSDLLATEKHTSSLYDTCIFEFTDEAARTYLNGIQKVEQNHGKSLYDYMKTNGMYS